MVFNFENWIFDKAGMGGGVFVDGDWCSISLSP